MLKTSKFVLKGKMIWFIWQKVVNNWIDFWNFKYSGWLTLIYWDCHRFLIRDRLQEKVNSPDGFWYISFRINWLVSNFNYFLLICISFLSLEEYHFNILSFIFFPTISLSALSNYIIKGKGYLSYSIIQF